MSDYTKTTDFAAKDNLVTGNPAKAGKGVEVDAEFTAIAASIATKYDSGDTILGANGAGANAGIGFAAQPTLGLVAMGTNGMGLLANGGVIASARGGYGGFQGLLVETGNVLYLPDGTLGNPSHTYFNDPDTGWYRVSTDRQDAVVGALDCFTCLKIDGSTTRAGFQNHTLTTTAPSAGGGSALPATPTGYITIIINGQTRQFAYY